MLPFIVIPLVSVAAVIVTMTICGVYATRPGTPADEFSSLLPPRAGGEDRGGMEQRRPSPAPSPATQPHRTEHQ